MRIGVDIGGTFTDVVVLTEDGQLRSWKAPSTPDQFAEGVLNGIELAARDLGVAADDLLTRTDAFIHGTTVTTNVVLTKTGERVGVITTKGFGDTYPLAREYRGHEPDPAKVTHPEPLAAREDILEVTERIDYSGRVIVPLDRDELVHAVDELVGRGIEAIALCFLWSFRNSEHERLAKEIIAERAPNVYVSASYEACPIMGEYERTSTTAINAYAGPVLERYARGLDDSLRDAGLRRSILIMKSDGGPASIETAVTRAAQTVYSGPTAGVIASRFVGRLVGEGDLVTFDMGGTSTDVALVFAGEPQTTSMQFLERQAFAAPMIDVTSVGAGGGSIGSVGSGRTLKVGPQSAGAEPGPACYGRGGDRATVTDANVVLGLISPDAFLGGQMLLDGAAAEQAVGALASDLELDVTETAFGIYRVVNARMADAIRLRTVYAGHDPREMTLVSFGGAGGLHCAGVATELGMRRIIIPPMASVFSAVGLLASDLTYSYAQAMTVMLGPGGKVPPDDVDAVNLVLEQLTDQAHSELDGQGVPSADRTFLHSVEMCYAGQILNMAVELPGSGLSEDDFADLAERFDRRYATLYGDGAAVPEAGYSLRTFKVVGSGAIGITDFVPHVQGNRSGAVKKGTRRTLLGSEAADQAEIEIFDGDLSAVGASFNGPCVIEYSNTNAHVPQGWTARIDDYRNLILESA